MRWLGAKHAPFDGPHPFFATPRLHLSLLLSLSKNHVACCRDWYLIALSVTKLSNLPCSSPKPYRVLPLIQFLRSSTQDLVLFGPEKYRNFWKFPHRHEFSSGSRGQSVSFKSNSIMATTPPPPSPSALRVPAAPRHGPGYDQFSPYPTRYSARIASQRASRSAEKTPPPEIPSSLSKGRSRGSPRKYRRVEEVHGKTLSPPGSSSNPPTDTFSKDSHSLAHNPSTLSGRSNRHSSTSHSQHHTVALPTPAKTPSKKKVSGDFSSTARTLFPHSNMRAKKSTPFSLESFDTSGPSKNIEIYTDSRDRVPKASAFETPFNPIKPVENGGLNDSSSAARSDDSICTSANEGTAGEPSTVVR